VLLGKVKEQVKVVRQLAEQSEQQRNLSSMSD
jgi:hypothetical protein